MTQALTAEGFVEKGKDAYKRKDYRKAAEAYRMATEAYTSSGDKLMAAEVANNCSVAWLKFGDAQAALDAVKGTEAVFAEGGDILRQGFAWGNQGSALEALGRQDEAITAYEQSATLLKQAGETEMRLYVMESLSELQFRTGRQLQALATMKAGLDGVKRPSLKQSLVRKILEIPFDILGGKK
jgi:tetratricopeptide (TPR) repeat protein